MHYKISWKNPQTRYVDIELTVPTGGAGEIQLNLPAWRPGRYELGNFAKNIQQWIPVGEDGSPLPFRKISKDAWLVKTQGQKSITVKYNYYAAELNAGSTWLDESQLYMNPVNCCLYCPEKIEQEHVLELIIPADFHVACALPADKQQVLPESGKKSILLRAVSFHELVDSPFIASPTLKGNNFIMDGVEFFLWFQGECKPDWSKLINDFFIFINEQFLTMKEFPATAYHFFFQIIPYRFYHGVEHLNSTVIVLGPGYGMMKGSGYENLLGVSSHELFHSWNVKAIRPIEMMPYDYSRENYSRQGFIYEGITTYYGDLFLFRSGVFNRDQYFATFNERIQKHFDNQGRFNLSVADSSFDTWLDGYQPGVPHRKTNIYDEGCLIAFMLDVLIRENTSNKNSLDDVMRLLFFQHAQNNMGYSEEDFRNLINQVAGTSLDDFLMRYVFGKNDYREILNHCLNFLGLELRVENTGKYYESFLGIKGQESPSGFKVSLVFPGSIAEKSGLRPGDEISGVNNIRINQDFDEWLKHFHPEKFVLQVLRNSEIRSCSFPADRGIYYRKWELGIQGNLTPAQMENFKAWTRRPILEPGG